MQSNRNMECSEGMGTTGKGEEDPHPHLPLGRCPPVVKSNLILGVYATLDHNRILKFGIWVFFNDFSYQGVTQLGVPRGYFVFRRRCHQ